MADLEKVELVTRYSIRELVAASRRLFKYTGALVEAALRESGRSEFTVSEAQAVVNKFAKRLV